MMYATYSPDDNKLRLYTTSRLDKETYEQARKLGFRWAPKQELFVAPAWSPEREDFLLELTGSEIEDEDKSLVERAEERSERFEEYSENRMADANRARDAVAAIADNIPLGQPILVGHHSERHARRDAKRIENGMRKAVKMFETSHYWTARAKGAIRHAKYKELPAVRHRRIKGLESERRKVVKNKDEAAMWLHLWTECGNEADTDLQKQVALKLANMCWLHLPRKEGDDPKHDFTPTAYDALENRYPNLYAPRTLEEIVEHAKAVYPRTIERCDRWLVHLDGRLSYEKTMLDEQIGTGELGSGMGGRFDIAPGGKVLTRDGWLTVIRVNKAQGAVNSVTTVAPSGVHWQKFWKYEIERVKDYQPPTEEQKAAVKKATKLPPICNYPGEGFREMTEAEWKARPKWSDFPYIDYRKATETAGRHRVRQMPPKGGHWYQKQQVFLTDAKRVDPPKPDPQPAALPTPEQAAPRFLGQVHKEPERTEFDDMRDSLKAGVKVTCVPQLFPTPRDVAAKLVELAGVRTGDRVLEPSAGTGAIIDALDSVPGAQVVAVEISPTLADNLRLRSNTTHQIKCADFLELEPEGSFDQCDQVIMNPPFENGADIKHVLHALKFLRRGGRLVAIVANGPRQQAKLKSEATHWEELPEGTFAGTGVRTAICVIDNGRPGNPSITATVAKMKEEA